jgi:hypothetical protein
MRYFKKLAVATAAAGLAVAGVVAAGGGVANAATDQSVTGCSTGSSGLLALNVFPTCDGPTSTVINPSSVTVAADPSFFSTLSALPGLNAVLTLLGQSLAENITYTLTCSVNGQLVTKDESFQATNSSQSSTVSMQDAVGSPQPNNCQLSDLHAVSLVSLSAPLLALLLGQHFTFGATATANTGVSGAIYMNNGTTSKGAGASTCVDDANNGNAGSKVQAYQCNSDLAQYWIQSSDGHIVRNGVCLTQSGGNAVLAKCSGTNNAQKWDVHGINGAFGTLVNHSTSQCLTAGSPKNFSQITVGNCTGAANQRWAGPAKSPA